MCGRYAQTQTARKQARLLALEVEAKRAETWNLAPSTLSLVIRQGADGPLADWLAWGYRESPIAELRPINARVETAATIPLFRPAWRARRCLVPVDGWYEWRKEHKLRQPYYFSRRDGVPLFFAGLWNAESFALLTTEADGDLTRIHNRRPLALAFEAGRQWLLGQPVTGMQTAEQVVAPGEIQFHPVSSRVNSPRYDDSELIKETAPPVPPPEPAQLSFL